MPTWKVKLADDKTGNVIVYDFRAKWDPKKVDDEFIGRSAAAQATLEAKKQIHFVPVGVELA